jgi:Calpain family cysteine protease
MFSALRRRLASHPRQSVSRSNHSARLKVESLEARDVPSGTPLTPPNDLHNHEIKAVARAEFMQDNGQLTRTAIIDLLDVVDGTKKAVFCDGKVSFKSATPNPNADLTASQLTDLRTLVRDASDWHLSDPVSNLLDKTVNQNPANENYQGSPLLATGKLTAGTSKSALQDLVGKWFYGTDLPAVPSAGLPDTVVYEKAQGVLFGTGGPKDTDIAQGWLGDCYFLSALGENAKQSPQTIKNMFINNHDGTYTVRFYEYDAASNTWNPDYVTVNLELPVFQQSGQFVYAGWYQHGKPTTYQDTSAVLWPALAEKAYAQLAEEGWSRSISDTGSGVDGTPSDWNTNSYDALNSGDGVAMRQLGDLNSAYDVVLSQATSADEKALEKAFAAGSLVTIGSLATEPAGVPTKNGVPLVIQTHVYALTAVDASKGLFTFTNPLDDSGPYPGDGQRTITLTWKQMKEYFNDFLVFAPNTDS